MGWGMIGALPTSAVTRFSSDLAELTGPLSPDARLGIAVSGGPDSLALLLLAHAAFPTRCFAATVDHRLRMQSAAEARFVADISARLGVPHATLTVQWPVQPPTKGIQEAARDARYAALLGWCADAGIGTLLTAHHADDQAETLLMRLARGAGLPGLAAIRPVQQAGGCRIARPLLRWRHAELAELCTAAGLIPIEDPSNADPRHERSRVRKLLRTADAPAADKLALSSAHLLEVEEAMRWLADEVIRSRVEITPDRISFDAGGLPREVKRRVLAELAGKAGAEPRGSAVSRAVEQLERGHATTLAGLRLTPGECWSVTFAPPRRAK
jgi:tRNA(Ile)-lysidine synthase